MISRLNNAYTNPAFPYIGKRFPSTINGPYSMNRLGSLSVKPLWINTKYRVTQNVKNKLRAIQII